MRSLVRSGYQLAMDVLWGVAMGLGMATYYTIIVVIIYLLRGLEPFDKYGVSLGTTLGAYWAGGVLGGALLGLLRPVTRNKIGAVFVGILVAIPAFTAMAVVMTDIDWVTVLIASVFFGTLGGIVFSVPLPSDAIRFDEETDRSRTPRL